MTQIKISTLLGDIFIDKTSNGSVALRSFIRRNATNMDTVIAVETMIAAHCFSGIDVSTEGYLLGINNAFENL